MAINRSPDLYFTKDYKHCWSKWFLSNRFASSYFIYQSYKDMV